jgi:outer membrane protein
MVTATESSPARRSGARALGALALLSLGGCLSNPPGVRGVAGTAPAPNVLWTPPHERAPRDTTPATHSPALPPDLARRVQALTLADIVDVALRNNTATAAAWADARAAAATYGAARGLYFPTVSAGVNATAVKTAATAGRISVQQRLYGPTLNASWLLFDFGTRSGSVTGARDALLAADWTHNAVLQNVVLQVETAYFQYHATKALLAAQQTTLKEAQTNLAAAEQRHRVGLATIADVLQAKTARSQAQLALETIEGTLQTTRGALALSMGLPANITYDVELPPDTTPPLGVSDSLDVLIAEAVRERPDLMAARATAQAARARVAVARGQALPSLVVSGTGGATYFFNKPLATQQGNSYSATIGLQIPLFSGWSQIYDVRAASAAARAADERRRGVEQQVIFQVFNSFYALRTATQRVRTSDDLLASATQSEQVALGRYRAGAGSLLDLLTAQAVLADARAQVIDARLAWYSTLAQLGHDAGILGLDGQSGLHLQPDSTGSNR